MIRGLTGICAGGYYQVSWFQACCFHFWRFTDMFDIGRSLVPVSLFRDDWGSIEGLYLTRHHKQERSSPLRSSSYALF